MEKEKTKLELRAEENGQESAFSMYDENEHFTQFGLTKREYFAGLALQSVIANGGYSEIEIPICAVNFADSLLEQLEK